MTRTWDIVTAVTATGCGLVGGVFFAFSGFVMSGLSRLPDREGIAAMQSINVTAVRPPLMIALFGTAALCVAVAIHAVTTWGDRRSVLLLAAALVYLLGAVALTIGFHVPRNDRLAALDPSAPGAAAAWHVYLSAWTTGNHVRALAGVLSAALFAVTLIGSRAAEGRTRAQAARTPVDTPYRAHEQAMRMAVATMPSAHQ